MTACADDPSFSDYKGHSCGDWQEASEYNLFCDVTTLQWRYPEEHREALHTSCCAACAGHTASAPDITSEEIRLFAPEHKERIMRKIASGEWAKGDKFEPVPEIVLERRRLRGLDKGSYRAESLQP